MQHETKTVSAQKLSSSSSTSTSSDFEVSVPSPGATINRMAALPASRERTVLERSHSDLDNMVKVLARGPGTNGCGVRIANGRKIFLFEISRHRPSCSVLDISDLDDFSDLKIGV